jgi:hypothetical protein
MTQRGRRGRGQVARRNGEDGDGPDCRRGCSRRHAGDHDHHPCGARTGRGEGARRKSVGHIHGRDHHSHCDGDDAWARLHLQRAGIGVGHHHIRRHCFHAAGMAPSRAARLPQHVPEDRGDCRSCDRYLSGSTRSEDAGGNPIYRWYRTRLLWTTVPIPVHHHRVRCRVGLPSRFAQHACSIQASTLP